VKVIKSTIIDNQELAEHGNDKKSVRRTERRKPFLKGFKERMLGREGANG